MKLLFRVLDESSSCDCMVVESVNAGNYSQKNQKPFVKKTGLEFSLHSNLLKTIVLFIRKKPLTDCLARR